MDVASRPSVETGTNVPSYSGGLAACVVVSDPRLDGCGPQAKCGNRGRRTQLQWRLGRRVVVSDPRSEGSGACANVSFSSVFISVFFSRLSAFCFHLVLLPRPSYAVFLQNTPLLSDAVPRVGTLGWYALPRWGNWDDDVSDHASVAPTDIATHGVGVEPLWPLDHHVSNSMP